MKVEFTAKNGRTMVMDERYAKVLQKMKRGTYQTRDMVAAPVVPPAQTPVADEAETPAKKKRASRKKSVADET